MAVSATPLLTSNAVAATNSSTKESNCADEEVTR